MRHNARFIKQVKILTPDANKNLLVKNFSIKDSYLLVKYVGNETYLVRSIFPYIDIDDLVTVFRILIQLSLKVPYSKFKVEYSYSDIGGESIYSVDNYVFNGGYYKEDVAIPKNIHRITLDV